MRNNYSYSISCKLTANQVLSFYLHSDGNTYFLFDQRFDKDVFLFFRNPVSASNIDYKSSRVFRIQNVISRLISYSTYIQQEYGIDYMPAKKRSTPYNRKSNKYRLFQEEAA